MHLGVIQEVRVLYPGNNTEFETLYKAITGNTVLMKDLSGSSLSDNELGLTSGSKASNLFYIRNILLFRWM